MCWSVDDVKPGRDGQRIWKILKKIQLSSDHAVKLGLTMVLRSWGPTMQLRIWDWIMEADNWVCHWGKEDWVLYRCGGG